MALIWQIHLPEFPQSSLIWFPVLTNLVIPQTWRGPFPDCSVLLNSYWDRINSAILTILAIWKMNNIIYQFCVISKLSWNKTKCVCETQMPPIMAIPRMAMVTRANILIPEGRSCHKKCSCAIWKSKDLLFRSYDQSQLKKIISQMSRSKGLVQTV